MTYRTSVRCNKISFEEFGTNETFIHLFPKAPNDQLEISKFEWKIDTNKVLEISADGLYSTALINLAENDVVTDNIQDNGDSDLGKDYTEDTYLEYEILETNPVFLKKINLTLEHASTLDFAVWADTAAIEGVQLYYEKGGEQYNLTKEMLNNADLIQYSDKAAITDQSLSVEWEFDSPMLQLATGDKIGTYIKTDDLSANSFFITLTLLKYIS